MLQILKMAFRDLERNRRRSFFSALALGIGLALLLLMASVISGEMRSSMDNAIKLQTGHLQVRARNYNEDRTSLAWEDLIENPEQLAAQIATLEPVTVATPRLYASGIVAEGDNTAGVRITGIDVSSPASAPYRDGLVSGSYLSADDREGVLMGQALATKLGLQAGDQINLLANTSNGDVNEQPFTIRGIYSTETPGYDEFVLLLPLSKAQAMSAAEGHASTIFVLLKDREQSTAVASALQTQQYDVQTWQQMNELIMTFEQFARSYMVLLYLIVLGITATVIVNTLVMAVYERTREIGILSALGMRSRTIMMMFFAESSLLAVGGILIGLILGGVIVWYASTYGFFVGNMGITGILLGERIYAYLTLNDMVTLSILTFIVALLAGLYPAVMAARMEPVEALHSGQ